MPDITMCTGEECPIRDTCWRFKAQPSTRQSYFLDPPLKDGECDHYWMLPYDTKENKTT